MDDPQQGKEANTNMKTKMKKLEVEIGGRKLGGMFEVKVDPEHGDLIPGGVMRQFELNNVAQLIASPEPLEGAHLRYIRKMLHVTQQDWAQQMGVSRQTLIGYESGENAIPLSSDLAARWVTQAHLVLNHQRFNMEHAVRQKPVAKKSAGALLRRVSSQVALLTALEAEEHCA